MMSTVNANTSPPREINTLELTFNVASEVFTYSHFSVIGVCGWLKESSWGIPYVVVSLELDEYMPDLLVTVFNESNDNPWDMMKAIYDPVTLSLANVLAQSTTGDELGNGQVEVSNDPQNKGNGLITKYVDVIGDPMPLNLFPFPHLRADTTPFIPYYSSAMDIAGRIGVAEKLQPNTYNPFGSIIGSSFVNKWGYEFPRDMTVPNPNDYIASVIAGLHGADIVTNNNPLHLVKSLDDSCGTNCAVANVIQETSDNNEIWQEVYPNNRHVQLGESQLTLAPGQSLGQADESAGNGNYVFAVWRHYRGCMQMDGKFLWATVHVGSTTKAGV